MAEPSPLALSIPAALRVIREAAKDSDNVIVVGHAVLRGKQRKITRRQMELCVQKGVIIEGPFRNQFGNWQVTMRRMAAGEEVSCVVAIDWPNKLIIITAFR